MTPYVKLVRLTPAEAVIETAFESAGVYVAGRVTGPACEYSTTVEVAHPIRDGQVVIPEPAWWDPESPFLYALSYEIWHAPQKRKWAEGRLRLGLSHARRDGGGVVCNGKAWPLRSVRLDAADERAFRAARAAGHNAVVVPVSAVKAACEIADRIGLFVTTDEPVEMDRLRHPSALTH